MPDTPMGSAAATCPGYEWRDNVPWKCQLPPGHKAPCKGNEPSASAATVARIAVLAEAVYDRDRDVLSYESQGDLRDIFMAAQALAEVSH